jgi:hypothetical protein
MRKAVVCMFMSSRQQLEGLGLGSRWRNSVVDHERMAQIWHWAGLDILVELLPQLFQIRCFLCLHGSTRLAFKH